MTREEQIQNEATNYGYWVAGGSPERVYASRDFEQGALWADSTYVKGDIEKESESYAQGVVGDISEDIRHLLATAYIAGAKRIER